jgi:hypothetical protein
MYRPGQALTVPEEPVSQISRQSAHEGGKVISPTHRPHGHSAAIRIISMKNSNDTIGNRTRDPGITKIYYRETVGHVFTKPVHIEGTTQSPPISCLSCFSS